MLQKGIFKRKHHRKLPLVGMTEYVTVANRYLRVPAKVDTGADTTSIWASNVTITADDALEFTLFDTKSPFYDGHVFHFEKGNYQVSVLRNSTGDNLIRYRVYLTIGLKNKKIRALVSLADRSRNGMPVLIGRATISNKFLVDVTLNPTGRRRRFEKKSQQFTSELLQNPQKFHQKYQPSQSRQKIPSRPEDPESSEQPSNSQESQPRP